MSGLSDSSPRVSGRDEEQNAALYHDRSVLSSAHIPVVGDDGVNVDSHVLNHPGRHDGEISPGIRDAVSRHGSVDELTVDVVTGL